MALNKLKRNVFYELLELVGRVFVVVRYSPEVSLGKRHFTEEEKHSGLTLVFTNRMPLQWDDHGITTTLTFGAQAQKCFIPSASIVAVYSPELQVQLTASSPEDAEDEEHPSHAPKEIDPARLRRGPRRATIREKGGQHGKLIEVDFANKIKKKSETEKG
jgi:hypothetical protein